ncbi:MAG: VWA domain-containing protein [Victivallales bacterium]|nr:VWA domain-containing protein [Victivallales bacterium]
MTMLRAAFIPICALLASVVCAGKAFSRWRVLRLIPGNHAGLHVFRSICVIAALLSLALWRPEAQTEDCVVFLLDCSDSMLAEDRLARAKEAIGVLAKAHSQGRLALVTFAGSTLVDLPPTRDQTAFAEALAAAVPGVSLARGTAPAFAVRQAEALGGTVAILFSDCETTQMEDGTIWEKRRIPLAVVACGRAPARIPDAHGGWIHDPATGDVALSTPYLGLPGTEKSSAEAVTTTVDALGEVEAMLSRRVGHRSRQWPLVLSLSLLLLSLTAGPLARFLLPLCIFAWPAMAAEPSTLPFPDAELPARAEQLRGALAEPKLAPEQRARLLSNLSAVLCRQAQLDSGAGTVSAAVAAAREALRLSPGLASAAQNLALARRLEESLPLASETGGDDPILAEEPPPTKASGTPHSPASTSQKSSLPSTSTSFGTWRELQEREAQRNLRPSRAQKPW